MKAVSLYQPYASLVVLGHKHYETRSWKTKYRGALVICASKEWNASLVTLKLEFELRYGMDLTETPLGAALGTVELVEVIPTEHLDKRKLSRMEKAFGDFSSGRYAWKLEKPIVFEEPIVCSGWPGLWEVA